LRVGRLERVGGEGGEDVGEDQLLVLLLMLDAQFDKGEGYRGQGG